MKKVPGQNEINFQKVVTGQEAGGFLLKVGNKAVQNEEGAYREKEINTQKVVTGQKSETVLLKIGLLSYRIKKGTWKKKL
jgi:hypothetical protein